MRKNFKHWVARMFIFRTIVFAIMTLIVMILWNNIVVQVIGFKSISFIQSFGLLLLMRILTGHIGPRGMGGPGGMMHRKGFMRDRWKNMNEEEKKQWMMGRGKGPWAKECEDKVE
jgi:Ca2+/H+ antiporter, TMEM165/GDT1 family